MAKKNKLETAKRITADIGKTFFALLGNFVNIGLKIFIVFGAIASCLLLYKMFPETALVLFAPLQTILEVLLLFLKAYLGVIILSLYVYSILLIVQGFKKINKDRKKKQTKLHNQFLDELAIKISKRMKKK